MQNIEIYNLTRKYSDISSSVMPTSELGKTWIYIHRGNNRKIERRRTRNNREERNSLIRRKIRRESNCKL